MPGPFGKDIPYSQKVGGHEREQNFNYCRIITIIVNLISSYFVFNTECSFLPKFCVFSLAMACLYMVMLSEEQENPRTKSRSEIKIENPKDNGTNTSFFSPLVLLSIVFQTVGNLSKVDTTLLTYVLIAVVTIFFMYVYFEHFADRKKWTSKMGLT